MSKADKVVLEEIVYASDDAELRGDLFRPPTPNGIGVLLMHGGGFTRGERSQLRGYGIQLGRLGYTSIACEYRLAPENKWPTQLRDVHAGLAQFHEIAPDLSVDRSKMVAWGNSAGGTLAMLAAALQKFPVAAVVAFYSACDYLGKGARAHGSPEAMSFLVGDDEKVPKLAAMSPINYARKDFPPTFLATGNSDEQVEWQDSHAMHLRLTEEGAHCELHIFDGAPHGFDAQPEYARVNIALADVFLSKHLT